VCRTLRGLTFAACQTPTTSRSLLLQQTGIVQRLLISKYQINMLQSQLQGILEPTVTLQGQN